MSDKLKLFLQRNRQLVIDEDFSTLLQKCPIELRTELRELYGEVEANFERKLDPEMYVAWWYTGNYTKIETESISVTKLKDAPVTSDSPYLHIVTEYRKIPNVSPVVKVDNDYYILDADIKSKIDDTRKRDRNLFKKFIDQIGNKIDNTVIDDYLIRYDTSDYGKGRKLHCRSKKDNTHHCAVNLSYEGIGKIRISGIDSHKNYTVVYVDTDIEKLEKAVLDMIHTFIQYEEGGKKVTK